MHYGSPNEKYKITYSQPAFASCFKERQFCEVRKLQGIEKRAYSMPGLRFLPRNEGLGFDKKDRKEAKERKSEEGRIKIEVGRHPHTESSYRMHTQLGTGQEVVINLI
jgi:hypothetical protein